MPRAITSTGTRPATIGKMIEMPATTAGIAAINTPAVAVIITDRTTPIRVAKATAADTKPIAVMATAAKATTHIRDEGTKDIKPITVKVNGADTARGMRIIVDRTRNRGADPNITVTPARRIAGRRGHPTSQHPNDLPLDTARSLDGAPHSDTARSLDAPRSLDINRHHAAVRN